MKTYALFILALFTVFFACSQKQDSQIELHSEHPPKPNLVFILADQWRAEATGYAGNLDVITPNLDKLAS